MDLQKYTPLIVSIHLLRASQAGIILIYAHKNLFLVNCGVEHEYKIRNELTIIAVRFSSFYEVIEYKSHGNL